MATSQSRLSSSLQCFRLGGIRDTGITVGDGAYATVLQYDFRGLKCVGKKIHRLLYEHASPALRADMLRRFREECELLGRLHHPNIVQFLGVHAETGSELPVLVMEYLPTNLSGYLDRHGVLPTEIGYGILRDVALGLRYLHEYSPPIVHRDLSANNVLLTASLSAKISDLGVAKILNITPSQMTQKMSTKAPGTPCYMPPEALIARPSYTRKIDSYSFGVMVLHVLCGEWPFPTDLFQRDPLNRNALVPVTEVDRRTQFMQKMGSDHPLSGLVRQCLSNIPDERPDSADILQQINTALSQVPAPAETVFQQLEGLRSEVQRLGMENHQLGNEIQTLGSENQRLETEVQTVGDDNVRLGNDNQSLMFEVLQLWNESQILASENQSLMAEIQTLREHSQTQPSSSGAAVTQSLTCKVERLSVHDLSLPVRAATNSTVSQLHPGVRLQWRRCADAPVEMSKAQVIVVGEMVYVGGGLTGDFKVFQYKDTWSTLPDCPVSFFGMALFRGRIITVGGIDENSSTGTGKVHVLREESQQWEEFLLPMPTARGVLSVATTSNAIVAAGGITAGEIAAMEPLTYSSAVEVYSSDTSQWYTADPLPRACAMMSSVIINNTWYLLGGASDSGALYDCWCASISSLVDKAKSSTRSVVRSVWSHLPPTPLIGSAAACLSGSLVAVGGMNDDDIMSSAVYAFLNSSWVKISNGDLPSPLVGCTTAQLSPVEVIVIGGEAEHGKHSKSVFIGTLHSQ